MITSNVISRVFKLKYNNQTGTCFIVGDDEKQYFVTAKHVLQTRDKKAVLLDELKDGGNIELFRDNKWLSTSVIKCKHSNQADISVFEKKKKIPAHPLPATMAGIVYGQDLFFLGFPYGMASDIGELNRNFPLPFVRKGILSLIDMNQKTKPFIIDGHNNPGFSGGPVVFKKPNSTEFQIAGVIHGYRPEFKVENAQYVPIENTNSGMVIAYPIGEAVELAKDII